MSDETISAEQIEGLEELITKILDSKIAQIPLGAEDIEQLNKSPAGTIIRLEEHVNALDEKNDEIRVQMVTKAEFAAMNSRLDDMVTKAELAAMESRFKAEFAITNSRIDDIESKMATKQDLEHMATKEEQNVIAQEVKALGVRLEEYGKRLSSKLLLTVSSGHFLL